MPSRQRLKGEASRPAATTSRKRPRRAPRPLRIISGGQTGVDRAALDAALEAGLPISGWCPAGRRAEDGRIAARYPLHETDSRGYSERTRWNVRDADATLIIASGAPTGGTALTEQFASLSARPICRVDIARLEDAASAAVEADRVSQWIEETGVLVLNVAGPRESSRPGVYARTKSFLALLFSGRCVDVPTTF